MQLTRAFDERVRGKDLLGQGCAGAGKTDDKDRPRVGLAPADAPLQELGRETGDDLTDKLGMLIGIIGKAACELAGGLVKVGDFELCGGSRVEPAPVGYRSKAEVQQAAFVVGQRLVSTRLSIAWTSASGSRPRRLVASRQ